MCHRCNQNSNRTHEEAWEVARREEAKEEAKRSEIYRYIGGKPSNPNEHHSFDLDGDI